MSHSEFRSGAEVENVETGHAIDYEPNTRLLAQYLCFRSSIRVERDNALYNVPS